MLSNYLKIAIRNLSRQKTFSIINVLGLSIGFFSVILIMLWAQDELSYDQFVPNKNNLYRVVQELEYAGQKNNQARTSIALTNALKSDYPEIAAATHYWIFDFVFEKNEDEFTGQGAVVDPDFINMFSIRLLRGNPTSVLDDPQNIIISQKFASKIFGDKNPIGETLRLYNDDMKITGVFEDYPLNSHLKFEYLIPVEWIYKIGAPRDSWNSNNSIYTYVQINNLHSLDEMNSKISGIITKNEPTIKSKVFLQPFGDVYLKSNFRGDVAGLGNIEYIYISIVMGIFIILIACFNFMNLSTAKSTVRAKEIGIRKVIGAYRRDLIKQFLGESMLVTLIALVFSILFVSWLLPSFNIFTGKSLQLDFFNNRLLLIGIIIITLFIGLLSGSYPAIVLSSFSPASVLKGSSKIKVSGSFFRKVLVVVQFSLSIAITIGMLITYSQLSYIQNKWLGFDKTNLLYFRVDDTMNKNMEAFKAEMERQRDVLGVSTCSHLLTDVTHVMGKVTWEGKDPSTEVRMNCLLSDHDFVETLGMQLKDGIDFSKEFNNEEVRSIILNETAVKKMGLAEPLGTTIEYGERKGVVVGVVKDFHFKPLQSEVEPMVLIKSNDEPFYLYIRIQPQNIQHTIASIGSVWEKIFPGIEYNPRFVDEAINSMYKNERQVQTMFELFTILAIVVSCMGLFGLASFVAERRTKEIGIRKTLGASVPKLVVMLSKEFSMWVLIANLIAWPAAYFTMQKWLEGFVYRCEINPMLFVIAGFTALVIAWITVSFQSVKAAMANPIKSLNYE